MDDALGVRRTERARDLPAESCRARCRQWAGATQTCRQGLALKVFHHDVGAAIGVVPKVVDLDDAGMIDRDRGVPARSMRARLTGDVSRSGREIAG